MTRKRKVASAFGTGAVILALPGAFSAQTLRQEPAYQTLDTVSAYSLICEEVISPYTRQKPTPEPHVRPRVGVHPRRQGNCTTHATAPLVGVETATINGIQPTEIDFEPPKPSGCLAILTCKEPPRGNPTPEPLSAPTSIRQAPVEPKMGDTRFINLRYQQL